MQITPKDLRDIYGLFEKKRTQNFNVPLSFSSPLKIEKLRFFNLIVYTNKKSYNAYWKIICQILQSRNRLLRTSQASNGLKLMSNLGSNSILRVPKSIKNCSKYVKVHQRWWQSKFFLLSTVFNQEFLDETITSYHLFRCPILVLIYS